MRCPQILIYASDSRIAHLLSDLIKTEKWSLQELRRPGAGLSLLRRGGPNVLVLRLGRDVEREMAMLDHLQGEFTDTVTIIICDGDNHALAGLAWDLGADCVLSPSQVPDHLADVVAGFMRSLKKGSAWSVDGGEDDAQSAEG